MIHGAIVVDSQLPLIVPRNTSSSKSLAVISIKNEVNIFGDVLSKINSHGHFICRHDEDSQIPCSSEKGSLSILIISLFLITLLLSFAIIDVAGAYRAKRDLVNLSEAAISRAAHNLDSGRYYSGDRSLLGSGPLGPINLLPIDCAAASQTFHQEIESMNVDSAPLSVLNFSCIDDLLRATVTVSLKPTLALPILQGSVMNRRLTIRASVSASNVIG